MENEHANEYVRSAALDGLLTLVACGRRSRDEVMTYIHGLFGTLERTPSMAWDGLAAACADLCPVEVAEDLRQAYDEGLINPGFIAWEEITGRETEGQTISVDDDLTSLHSRSSRRSVLESEAPKPVVHE